MNPYNLQTSVLALVVALATACGAADRTDADGRDESFLALMGSDGKADGLRVTEGSVEALAVLEVANTLSFQDLLNGVGLDQRATANIIARREGNPHDAHDDDPYDSLRELDDTPWIGVRAFTLLLDHARRGGFVDAMRRPTACEIDADCGEGVCHVDHCYDVRRVPVDLAGQRSLDIADDGSWWVRAHAGGTTVREARGVVTLEAVDTSSYADPDIDAWLATLPDGQLTALTRNGQTVLSEFGAAATLGAFNHAVDVAYDADGDLLIAAEARDMQGTPQGLVVVAQTERGWREEFKRPFDGQREPGEVQTTKFTRGDDGRLQIWVDVDGTARRFDRGTDESWREAMVIDMAGEGFGERGSDRAVEFLQAADGTVFIHRSTWNFARLHQVVRIEGSMVTAVVDMPTATRRVAPHPDGSFSVIAADGALSRYMRGAQSGGTASLPFVLTGDEIVRSRGEDLYVLGSAELVILTAR